MEFARLGNHFLTVCPYCDRLFERPVATDEEADAHDALQTAYRQHLAMAPECKRQADAQPSITEAMKACQDAYAAGEPERQKALDSHPDNGRSGFWLVEGIRHDARTKASSAREAIERCSDAVQSWESPEATFMGEDLPDVF